MVRRKPGFTLADVAAAIAIAGLLLGAILQKPDLRRLAEQNSNGGSEILSSSPPLTESRQEETA